MAGSWTVTLTGVAATRDILQAAKENAGALAATALYQEALLMMADSQEQVPVRWGTLRGTGTVYAPTRQGTSIEVILAYGGPAAEYAWIQHENLALHHSEGEKAKYLEDPVMARARTIDAELAARMSWLFESKGPVGWPSDVWHAPQVIQRLTTTGRPSTRRSPRRTPGTSGA